MYLKRLFKTVALKGFPLEKGGERRKRKINWNLKAWNSVTKHRCPGLEVHEVFAVAGADTLCRVTATVDSRFPDSQSLNLWPRRACQDVAGTLEVDVLYFSILELLILLCVKRQQVNKHCHQHCYWELEDLSFCPDPQCKLTTLHPKWTYVLCLLIAESSPGPCDDLLLVHQPADLVPGFLSMVIPTTLLLKKTPFQWTTVTQETFSHHDVTFTSTPVLLCPDSAQPFIVQSRVFKPNNWSYFITIKAKFIP